MRSLLRVAAIAALTVVVPATVVTTQAQASPAAGAAGGGITLAIDSVTPQFAAPGKTITVSGTITNGTSTPQAGFNLQLYTSQTWFTGRDEMTNYTDGTETPSLSPVGNLDLVSTSVRPGETVAWHARFTEAEAGYPQFGVYPLEVMLTDLGGAPLASGRTGRTLLPYWPGNNQGTPKLKIAWVWPLIDRPHRQACNALTSNSLAPSVAAGGRLSNLLAAGTANPQSDLTWAIDPALLSDLSVMSGKNGYTVAGPSFHPSDCEGGVIPEKTSGAAASWLRKLKSATATQPALITPYGNTDVAALTHHYGMTTDLVNDYTLGQQVSEEVLDRSFGTNFALPPGGLADQSVLTTLASYEHVTSVVLSSSEMEPVNPDEADDAVTSFRTMAGQKINVLLADDGITTMLSGAGSATSPSAQFGLEQQFLAETAMIASELPDTHRSVVVSPPETWAPSEALASRLLQESEAPWLQPATLSSLAGSHDSESQTSRRQPADSKVDPSELSGGYLTQIQGQDGLDGQLGLYKSVLFQAPVSYTTQLDEALAATESSAWRGGAATARLGGGPAAGQALVNGLSAYLDTAQKQIRIITSPEITMGGSSGVLPVNIQNTLKQSVQVRLVASVPVAAQGAAPPLQVARIVSPIKIPAGQIVGVKLHVSSAPSGTTNIQLSLASDNGRQLPRSDTPLSVHSTRYGQDILILIVGAIGLLVLSSVWRSGRRRRAGDGNAGAVAGAEQSGDSVAWDGAGTPPDRAGPGNVMGGAQNPTEAPDDLADARRWADDT